MFVSAKTVTSYWLQTRMALYTFMRDSAMDALLALTLIRLPVVNVHKLLLDVQCVSIPVPAKVVCMGIM